MATYSSSCASLQRMGIVAGYLPNGLIVDVSLKEACQQCAEGRGCGMGLLARRQRQRVVVYPPNDCAKLSIRYPLGSSVMLTLPKNDISLLALIIYALPLFIALFASGSGVLLGGNEWLCAGLFFGTLLCGMVALKYLIRGRMERFRPRLVS
ncbi:SoxR reducing system RseC family protein [Vreelandella aquamarina]|uniref:SoxR reducing system RseC family protein n=1 Tax=Vreelandella aquamarina TaxID=77097 RepID=UPI00384F272F